jgi:hypothetical protein
VKKLVIGCALALVLFGIAGSVAFYYFVYKPARSFVASLSELGQLAEMDAKVTNTQTFAAPSADTLTEAQVRRFVAVQESLHTRMGTRASELQAKYQAIEARSPEGIGMAEAVGAYRDLFGIIAEAKKAQVEALNAQNSGAAASGAVAGNAQSDEVSKGPAPPAALETDTVGVGIPDANKALVAPYKDKAATWLIYGAFGL